MEEILLETGCGTVRGWESERCRQFLGLRYAYAARFEYAVPEEHWEGVYDATQFGSCCPQFRDYHTHMESPMRRFYKKEFRTGLVYTSDEDCLHMNIYAPKEGKNCPVVLFFHGGGFDSGMNFEQAFDGSGLAEKGVVAVFANYRVGVLGYLCHEELKRLHGRDGNFGLDDQLCAIHWVKAHIGDFGGDGDNITIMGQSAGAIAVQLLCLNPENEGLFRHAVMLSGGGLFPKAGQPRRAEDTHAYWEQYMHLAGCRTLEQLRRASPEALFDASEAIRKIRRDNVNNCMPVIDGKLIPAPVSELIRKPLKIDYWISYTNSDMFGPILAYVGNVFGKANGAYLCFFDLDAPGDDNLAFHSADLRYLFSTLEGSWRPYRARDYEASDELRGYLVNFARCGDPNGPGLPRWDKAAPGPRAKALCITPEGTKMGKPAYGRIARNYLRRPDPIA